MNDYTKGTLKRKEPEAPKAHWGCQVVAVVLFCTLAWIVVDYLVKGFAK